AAGAGSNAPAERELVPAAGTETPALAAPRQLRIAHADGSPARGLPVLLWRADERPRWARRVDDENDATMAPGVANAYYEPSPPAATLATDAQGLVALPPGGAGIAVSVQFAKDQWFSADLPPPENALVLPALGEIEVVAQGAPSGTQWEGL